MKCLFAAVLSGLLGLAMSTCTQKEPMADFKNEMKLGDWYLVAVTDKDGPGLAKLTCEEMYASETGGNWKLTGSGLDTNNHRIANWTEEGTQDEKHGAFSYVNKHVGKFDLTVLGANDHCMVIHSCNLPWKDVSYTWVYCRDKKESFDHVKSGVEPILTSHGIEVSSLKAKDNSHC